VAFEDHAFKIKTSLNLENIDRPCLNTSERERERKEERAIAAVKCTSFG
jgi:hypothetical protein